MDDSGRWRHTLIRLWVITSLGLIAWLGYSMFWSEDKTDFMPGALTDGHYQIAEACSACHAEPFPSGEVLQKACENCHGKDRKKPLDSHPRTKFTDPRNADTLKNIDARLCISCHTEHQPDRVKANGVTQPDDFCVYCHKDIGDDRASHKDLSFDTCNDAGCHNFHSNRALYTDFLLKHVNEPALLENPLLRQREFGDVLDELMDYPHDRYPVRQLAADEADAPSDIPVNVIVNRDWIETAHARAGVNCSACHTVTNEDTGEKTWMSKPGYKGCAQCHDIEVDRFKRGKHGMRLAVELSPMTPGKARLPMKEKVRDKEIECATCHSAHRFDIQQAAVEACLGCHDDKHSLAYKKSPHYALWEKELSGDGEPGSGVSCASCHMPRINYDVSEWMSRIVVDHNQNATLSPNEKMIRPACLHCHGLAFSINALADSNLVENNFRGKPAFSTRSIDMAIADQERAERERERKSMKENLH